MAFYNYSAYAKSPIKDNKDEDISRTDRSKPNSGLSSMSTPNPSSVERQPLTGGRPRAKNTAREMAISRRLKKYSSSEESEEMYKQ